MRRRAWLLVLPLLLAECSGTDTPEALETPAAKVDHVVDGDTIVLADRSRVRLVQIDAPERATNECYWREARQELIGLLPRGATVRLEADPKLDQVDEHGRLLRYVHRGRLNVTLELVRLGAARHYFFFATRGRYAARLLTLEREARAAHRGLWGACGR